jgi:protein-S-isoprenylcysteine O-methyltransferase Ste14
MLVGSGLGVIAGSVVTVATIDLERPARIVTTGPYALTRHPMYEAWTSIYGGTALVTRNGWLAMLLPLLLGIVHRTAVGEERRLRRELGLVYDDYARRVPRYVWMRGVRRSGPGAPAARATARCR